MATQIRERADSLREAAREDSHVSLTDLGRSNAWRRQLSDRGVLQLMDRSDTAGFLLSVDAMNELLDSLKDYEAQIETMSVRDLFDSRRHRLETKTGEALASCAAESFDRRFDDLMKVLDESGSKSEGDR